MPLPRSLSLTSQSPEHQTNECFLSFISTSHLFINAHKAVAGTYRWQSPLSCLSDETEVAEFTKRFYGRMDVTGSGGRSHISLHNVRRHAHLCVCVCVRPCSYTAHTRLDLGRICCKMEAERLENGACALRRRRLQQRSIDLKGALTLTREEMSNLDARRRERRRQEPADAVPRARAASSVTPTHAAAGSTCPGTTLSPPPMGSTRRPAARRRRQKSASGSTSGQRDASGTLRTCPDITNDH